MTAYHKRSRGLRHSLAVKRGIERMHESGFTRVESTRAEMKAIRSSRKVGVWRGLVTLLGKMDVPIPTPDEIEHQLLTEFRRGYVQALKDVKRERERFEAQSYADAMRPISKQEARTISHVFDRRT